MIFKTKIFSFFFSDNFVLVSTDSSIQKDHHHSISPVSPNGKNAAPSAPSAKLISVKVRQAPTINEIHYYNGTNNNPSSPAQRTPAIHT
jgi:hypothetical protein